MTSAGGPPDDSPLARSGRRWRGASRPTDATSWALTSLGVSALCVASAWGTVKGMRGALESLHRSSILADVILLVLGLIATALLIPSIHSFQIAGRARAALASGDVI